MSPGGDAAWERLRARFGERLVRELPLLQAHRLCATPPPPDDARQALTRLAHGLAGAGGTFGFSDISVAAAALEDCIRQDGDALAVDAALHTLIETVTKALSGPARPSPA